MRAAKRLRRVFSRVSLLFLIPLALWVVASLLSDSVWFNGRIEEPLRNAVRRAAGGHLDVEDIRLHLWSTPSLTLTGVALTPTEEAGRGTPATVKRATVKRIEARVDPYALLRGAVEISRLDLEEPELGIVQTSESRIDGAPFPEAGAVLPFRFAIKEIVARDGRIAVTRGVGGAAPVLRARFDRLFLRLASRSATPDQGSWAQALSAVLGVASLKGLRLAAGKSDLSGDIELRRRDKGIEASLDLRSRQLTLEDFRRFDLAGGGKGTKGDSRADAPDPLDRVTFGAASHGVKLRAAWRGERFRIGRTNLGDLRFILSLDRKGLELRLLHADYGGGRVKGHVALKADPDSTLRTDVSLRARGVDLARLVKEAGAAGAMSGKLGIDLDLSGRGATVARTAATATGHFRFVAPRSHVRGRVLDLLESDLVALVFPWIDEEDGTREGCFVGHFAIDNGIAASRVLAFDTGRVFVSGKGSVDLGGQSLDLVLTTHPKEELRIALPTGLSLKGPLLSPRVTVSTGEAAEDLLAAAVDMITSPVELLLSPFEGEEPEKVPPCSDATARFGGSAPGPRPSETRPTETRSSFEKGEEPSRRDAERIGVPDGGIPTPLP